MARLQLFRIKYCDRDDMMGGARFNTVYPFEYIEGNLIYHDSERLLWIVRLANFGFWMIRFCWISKGTYMWPGFNFESTPASEKVILDEGDE